MSGGDKKGALIVGYSPEIPDRGPKKSVSTSFFAGLLLDEDGAAAYSKTTVAVQGSLDGGRFRPVGASAAVTLRWPTSITIRRFSSDRDFRLKLGLQDGHI